MSSTAEHLQTLRHEASPVEPLTCLARIVQNASSPELMRSLGLQLASAIGQLGSFLTIRGEVAVEHYFAQAITLACLQPSTSDVTSYEQTLTLFILYDRRKAYLPRLVAVPSLSVISAPTTHFIQSLRSQSSFQAIYDTAAMLDRYGAISRSRKKMERIVLLSRELGGRSLLAPPTAVEERYLALAVE
jgi:hypothetical protein